MIQLSLHFNIILSILKTLTYFDYSRAERKQFYINQLTNGPHIEVERCNYQKYRQENPKTYKQIHVDAKRCLWNFFDYQKLQQHFKTIQPEPQIKLYEEKEKLTRFHQRYLELFIIDVMNNEPQSQYFQGLSQILGCLYFIFLDEQFFGMTNLLQDYIDNKFSQEENDFQPVNSGIDYLIPNYETVLEVALRIAETTLKPLFEHDLNQMQKYINTSTIYLKYFDSQLYYLITETPQLKEIAPQILIGALMSSMQYNSSNIQNCLRYMDTTIQSDYIFMVFLASAALSLAVRYRNPNIFENNQNVLPVVDQSAQIMDPINDDMLYRIMSSLDYAEQIINNFAQQAINFALVGYYLVYISPEYVGSTAMNLINQQFNIQKIFGCFKYQNKQELLQMNFFKSKESIFKGIGPFTSPEEIKIYYYKLIMDSVTNIWNVEEKDKWIGKVQANKTVKQINHLGNKISQGFQKLKNSISQAIEKQNEDVQQVAYKLDSQIVSTQQK